MGVILKFTYMLQFLHNLHMNITSVSFFLGLWYMMNHQLPRHQSHPGYPFQQSYLQ